MTVFVIHLCAWIKPLSYPKWALYTADVRLAVCAPPSLVAAIEHEWLEVYLFMPFRLSFPLHFGAKKWQASAAEAAEIRLALIALLVWLDCFVSGNIWCKHRHLSCLVLSMFHWKIIHFSRCQGFIGNIEMGESKCLLLCTLCFFKWWMQI